MPRMSPRRHSVLAAALQDRRVDFLGSDDFAPANKAKAAEAVNEALAAGWGGFEIAEQVPLEEIATAHERVEAPRRCGRIVLVV